MAAGVLPIRHKALRRIDSTHRLHYLASLKSPRLPSGDCPFRPLWIRTLGE